MCCVYHYREDDGQKSRLEHPKNHQAHDLDQCEEMNSSQRHMAQEGEIRLVFGGHHIQFYPVPELCTVYKVGEVV